MNIEDIDNICKAILEKEEEADRETGRQIREKYTQNRRLISIPRMEQRK